MSYLWGLVVAIYLRKSRSDIEDEKKALARGEVYDTLQRHRKELLTFARKNKLKIVDIFEEVVSGDTIEARPEVQSLLENAKNGKYDGVLVVAYDRLGRGDKMDQGLIEKTFKESDTLIITPKTTIDLNDEQGEMQADFEGFLSRMEYRKIKGRLRDGKIRAINEGRNISAAAPIGYYVDNEQKLAIDPKEVHIPRMIFELAIQGFGCVQIANQLYEAGIRHRTGNPIGEQTVRHIIGNPKYIGTQFYSRYSKKPTFAPNSHTPIVSEEVFNEANRMIKIRKPSHNPASFPMRNPLSTILRCSVCDSAMVLRRYIVKGKEYNYYYCRKKYCETVSASMDEVINDLINKLRDTLSNVAVEYEEDENSLLPTLENQLSQAQKKLKTFETKRDNIHDLLEDGTYTKDTFIDRLNKVEMEEQQVLDTIASLNEKIALEREKDSNLNRTLPAISNALEVFEQCDARQKNILLKSFIDKIMYTRTSKKEDFKLDISYHQ